MAISVPLLCKFLNSHSGVFFFQLQKKGEYFNERLRNKLALAVPVYTFMMNNA